ncbi:MAG: nuclear transport factor 2 family protein [Nocardioides sp.]
MPASREHISGVVEDYLRLVATGTADEVVALYAEDATLEDPVGSQVLRGREAIRAFYAAIEPLTIETRLFHLRTVAGEAAFHFEVTTITDDATFTMAPIEVMTFDEDGRITSMRAWWSDTDMVAS